METILVKSIEAVYPEWTAGKCTIFDGLSEVERVVMRGEGSRTSYIIWLVGGQWRHAIGDDELRVEWQPPAAAQDVQADAGAGIVYAYFLWKDTGAVASVCDGDFIAQNRANPALVEVDADRWTRLAHEGERAWERLQAENAQLKAIVAKHIGFSPDAFVEASVDTVAEELDLDRIRTDGNAEKLRSENAALIERVTALTAALDAVSNASQEVLDLRRNFTALTGIVVPMGGNTLGTEEGRMLRLLMRDLGYKRENNCVAGGWDVRYGKDDTWSEWMPIRFETSLAGEYRVAIAGIEAYAYRAQTTDERGGE